LIEATYDGKVLTPVNPSALKPNTRLPAPGGRGFSSSRATTAWDLLEKMAGTLTKPADWAAGHDAYFYPPAKADKTP